MRDSMTADEWARLTTYVKACTASRDRVTGKQMVCVPAGEMARLLEYVEGMRAKGGDHQLAVGDLRIRRGWMYEASRFIWNVSRWDGKGWRQIMKHPVTGQYVEPFISIAEAAAFIIEIETGAKQ